MKSYIPTKNSLPYRVAQFFIDNPDEELTTRDVAEKFGTHYAGVHASLRLAVQNGWLRRANNADLELAYSRGPKARQEALDNAPVRPAPAKDAPAADDGPSGDTLVSPFATVRSQKEAAHKNLLRDLENIQIEQGVPLPLRSHDMGAVWGRAFDRLEPGDSFALPAYAQRSLSKAATRYRRAKGVPLVIRKTEEGVRVWRMQG